MDEDKLIAKMQRRIARAVVGASTLRGAGQQGLGEPARAFLAEVELGRFSTRTGRAFRARLDKQTERFMSEVQPRPPFGYARKWLNLLLRDAQYHRVLSERFRLGQARDWYEVPLDGLIAERLRDHDSGLPRWPRLRHLDAETHGAFQRAARDCAQRMGIPRVYLDDVWWSTREEGDRGAPSSSRGTRRLIALIPGNVALNNPEALDEFVRVTQEDLRNHPVPRRRSRAQQRDGNGTPVPREGDDA
jgi:hypothetical protein